MNKKTLALIPVFSIFAIIIVILYSSEQQKIAEAIVESKIEMCDLIKRGHFKNICYQNFYDLKMSSELKKVNENYLIFIWEAAVALFLALFFAGKAYFNFLETWITNKTLGCIILKYRNLQEDGLYFFVRITFASLLVALFVYFENFIL